jgi:uncharacterized small protein (DUF1192 family)
VRYEVEAQLEELKQYVKSLRLEDMKHFNELYAQVKNHISSISYANPLNPNQLMQWSAIIELEKRISKLKDEINRHISEQG